MQGSLRGSGQRSLMRAGRENFLLTRIFKLRALRRPRRPPKWFTGLAIAAVFGAALFMGHPWILTQAAAWLVTNDPLIRADALIVLSGDSTGERVMQGVALWRQGYAPTVILSGGPIGRWTTAAEVMRKEALLLGLPSRAILLEEESMSTWEQAVKTLPMVRKLGARRVIVVTSPYHARRARWTFRRIFGPAGIEVLVSPSPYSKFQVDRWWAREQDTEDVLLEYFKMLHYLLRFRSSPREGSRVEAKGP